MKKEKKRIGFYPCLAVGHHNVCLTIGKVLLDNFEDEVEVYFITDDYFADKIAKVDSRFKLVRLEYGGKKKDESRYNDLVTKLESFLELPLIERLASALNVFVACDPTEEEIDRLAEKPIRELKLDFLLCDQFAHFASMGLTAYGFVVSCNPALFGLDGCPMFGSDAGVNEKERIEQFKQEFAKYNKKLQEEYHRRFKRRGMMYSSKKNLPINVPIGDHFNLYSFPRELDFVPEESKKEHSLWRIESAILPDRLPPPFELPDQLKDQPGDLIYVSVGSLYSVFTARFQRLLDMLDRLPYRYIVSLGPKGNRMRLPSSKFVGYNYVNQLAVLQSLDCKLMITHGGNNTLCECIYFGVKSIVIPVHGDQVNNGKRLEETGYGYQLDPNDIDETKLADIIERALSNEKMSEKLRTASERIQRVQKETLFSVCRRIVNYVNNL